MKEIIVLVGISGSGKSTWASDFIQKNPHSIRLNRDTVRDMLIPDSSRDPKYYHRPDINLL